MSGCIRKNNEKNPVDPEVQAALTHCMSWRNMQDYPKVHVYLDSVFNANKDIPKSHFVLKYYYLADMYTHQIQDYNKSKIYLDSAESIGFSDPELVNTAIVFYFLKGNNALEQRKYEEAFDAYHQGKRIIDSTGEICRGEAFYLAMAYLHFRQEKYADALNYYKLRRTLYLSCDSTASTFNTHNELMSLNNIGLCFERMGNCDSALFYYNLGISLYNNKLNPKINRDQLAQIYGVLLGNKGGCLLKIGHYSEAEQYLTQSIGINYLPNRDMKDAILTKIKLADLCFQTGKTTSCLDMIEDLNQDLIKLPYLTAEQRLTELTSRYYEHSKDFEKAHYYLKRNYALKDSARIHGNLLDAKYDFITEIDQLKKEMDIVKLKNTNHKKNNLLIVISLFLLAGVMLAISLHVKRNRDKKYVHKLQVLNNKILNNNIKLENSLKALEQSQTENSRIMKILAHDLRSPIAGIVNAIRVLKGNHLEPQEYQKILEVIEKSSLNSLDFVDDLLNLNDTPEGNLLHQTDLSIILDTCIQLHKPQADEKRIQLNGALIPVEILANPQRIWRVFNNILVNAIKFTPSGKEIYVQMTLNQFSVLVSIKDQGIGIPDAIKDKIFDMFSGAGRLGTKGEKTFGLGLAISKQIVESHKGKIWFESREGIGTTFFVELPLNQF